MALLFFISLVPLVLFVLVDYYTRSIKAGVVSAVASAVAMGGVAYWLMGQFDYEVIVIVATMLLMGAISIKMNNPVYFKFQPVVTGIVLAVILAYFQWYDTPLLVKMLPKMLERMAEHQLVNPQVLAHLRSKEQMASLVSINRNIIFLILIHAGFVAYSALKLRNSLWLLVKAAGLPFIVLGCFLLKFFGV